MLSGLKPLVLSKTSSQLGRVHYMDKAARREIFIGGLMADKFRQDVSMLIAAEPSIEEVDHFLSGFEGIMHQPLLMH